MNKEEKQESKRLPGFYIALCCCVIAVGIAGYFTERASDNNEESITQPEIADVSPTDASVSANADADNVEVPEIYIEADGNPVSAEAEVSVPEETHVPQVVYEDMTEPAAEEAAAIVSSPTFAMPAQGEILEAYSDTLLYNSALGDWRTHNGMDIEVSSGGSVCAAANGTISKISSDAMGEYVVIEHDGGFSTKYCSLSSVEDIAEGNTVSAGEVIGIVSDNKAENVTAPHLHFELYKDGTAVNPAEYIQ